MRVICLSILFVVAVAGMSYADAGAHKPKSGNTSSFHAFNKIQTPQAMSNAQLDAIKGMGSLSVKGGVTWPFLNGKK